jgi:hypothetical protein
MLNIIDGLTGEQRAVINVLIEQALIDNEKTVAKETNVSALSPTNCVNCGAVIDPNVDHCEYCGTSYTLMGVKACPSEQVVHLKLENKLLASKIDIMQRYNDAIRAMGSYARHY